MSAADASDEAVKLKIVESPIPATWESPTPARSFHSLARHDRLGPTFSSRNRRRIDRRHGARRHRDARLQNEQSQLFDHPFVGCHNTAQRRPRCP